ncbi:hypothetical protein AVEN_148180-1, partial [Araneus ventricosus]
FSFLLGTVLLAVHASPSAHSQSDEFTWAPLCPTSSSGKIPRLIPDPSNCRSAFVCSEGKPLRYFCPRGLVFQATEQECVPRKACTKGLSPMFHPDDNTPIITMMEFKTGLIVEENIVDTISSPIDVPFSSLSPGSKMALQKNTPQIYEHTDVLKASVHY